MGAIERYLLGQFSASEAEEFERHFFDCLECARDLHAGAVFEDNARAVFLEERAQADPTAADRAEAGRESKDKPRSLGSNRSFWDWFWRPRTWAPALASLVFAAVAAYQVFVVNPGLRGQLNEALAPQPVASHVLPPISRGDSRVLEIPPGGRFYTIYMDPTWEGSFAAYICEVRDETGATRFSLRVPAPPPGEPIQILMARSLLPSGRYTVVIRNAAENGKPETELARYALILKLD
jgi:hypothetical protein